MTPFLTVVVDLLIVAGLIGFLVYVFSPLKDAPRDGKGGPFFTTFPFFDRGKQGEWYVNNHLSRLPEEYHVICDLLIKIGSQPSCQIDHVVVSTKGVFVIETKNYNGTIVGDGNKDYWTQYIGRETHELYNPERQNRGHVNCLKMLLPSVADKDIHPVVVFTYSSELKLRNLNGPVVNTGQLRGLIMQYQTPCISEEKVAQIVALLTKYTSYSREDVAAHNREIWEANSRRRARIAEGRCPKCGGMLVERYGTYGRFWGCANYPGCRYTTKERPPTSVPRTWL